MRAPVKWDEIRELQPEPGEGIAPGSTAMLAFYADDGQGPGRGGRSRCGAFAFIIWMAAARAKLRAGTLSVPRAPFLVVALDPTIEVALEFGDRSIDLLSEGDGVELIEHGLVEPLGDSLGLWALGLGARYVPMAWPDQWSALGLRGPAER
jgi:hypothetical protein